ncbi:MAG: metal-dependent hydrolase [Vicinamibacterales bacterium]
MDNLCHTLVGAALGETGLKRRTRFGTLTLALASNLPDLDVLVFLTPVTPVSFRRGWTHGPLAQALLPVLLTLVMLAWSRRRPARPGEPPAHAGWLLLFSYVGVLLHVGMDFLNNYGVRLLMPWSGRWFYGDTVFIVDPWLYLFLGGGWWLARRRGVGRPAVAGLLLAVLYVAALVPIARTARARVLEAWTAQAGRPPQALMVGPWFGTPFQKQVIVDRGDGYDTGSFSVLSGALTLDGRLDTLPREHPAVRAALADPRVRAILVWSRFPRFEIQDGAEGRSVLLTDVRFGRLRGAGMAVVPIP